MSFKSAYKDIIDKAKAEDRVKNSKIYYERHHIVPDFLFKNRSRKGPSGHLDGDPNSEENLILLTFQEHLLCHYYLYEICKGTRYEYSAGTALQFFFTKATGNHMRQRTLTEVDVEFLNQLSHLRQIGLKSISNARRGKMPVVDATTRKSIGSVDVTHPKVVSGEWVHHSKGRPFKGKLKPQDGKNNNNYKGITDEQKNRVLKCLTDSLVDELYVSRKMFISNIKKEFTEFKKLSEVWVKNHMGDLHAIVELHNSLYGTRYIFDPYYRSAAQKQILSQKTREFNLTIGRNHYVKN
jgi:F0F1-type ATP synthase gamma subunit